MPLPNLIRDETCPFCDSSFRGTNRFVNRAVQGLAQVNCPVCGAYEITGTAIDVVAMWNISDDTRTAIAFTIRRMTDRAEMPRLTSDVLQQLKQGVALLRPENLLDEAVLWFGNHSTHVGQRFQVSSPEYRAVLGAWNNPAFNFVAEWMIASGLFHGIRPKGLRDVALPMAECYLMPAGWHRYTELTNSRTTNRFGFMAMNYGDAELDTIVRDHFAVEVRKTGFDLRRLDEGQGAGLIDDQLRVAIRTARFLVCDLTHGNRGAYWEAGFAEGLGRPVIYTCRRDIFQDRLHEHHPHFDTKHMVTVPWDAADPVPAARRLKDTIRATLPAEARLTD